MTLGSRWSSSMALRFLSPGFLRCKGLAGLTEVIARSTELRSERLAGLTEVIARSTELRSERIFSEILTFS
jgi:hypothetical protein